MSENNEIEVKKHRGRPKGSKNKNGYHIDPEVMAKRTAHLASKRGGFGEKEEDKVLVYRLMHETLESYRKPKVKSDEELAARLDEFFKECAEQAKIPVVEEMEMCTGYSHMGLNDIENGKNPGFSPETRHILKRAKEFLKTFDAKLVMTGEINPIVYFFRAKNYYGMKDQQEITVQGNDNRVQQMSDEDIKNWYLEDGKKVETEFADKEGGDS